MNGDPFFSGFENWSKIDDFFQSVHDFFQGIIHFFGTGLDSLDQIPDIFLNIWHWTSLTFDFIPDYFVTLLTWFIIACIVIRFLRW